MNSAPVKMKNGGINWRPKGSLNASSPEALDEAYATPVDKIDPV